MEKFSKSKFVIKLKSIFKRKTFMEWKPISEGELWDLINAAYENMTPTQRKIWEIIKVTPVKWNEESMGRLGNGFWVVAIIGSSVIWYNDIEGGFNQSSYNSCGEIAEYWCNQDELQFAVQNVINLLNDGYYSSGRAGPPKSVA